MFYFLYEKLTFVFLWFWYICNVYISMWNFLKYLTSASKLYIRITYAIISCLFKNTKRYIFIHRFMYAEKNRKSLCVVSIIGKHWGSNLRKNRIIKYSRINSQNNAIWGLNVWNSSQKCRILLNIRNLKRIKNVKIK